MDQVRVDAVEGGVRIQIVDKEGSPMFQLGSAEPTEKCREILAAVAEVVREQDAKIAVEGHTDAAPFRGDQITNWELSTSRASAARRMLETNGTDPLRVARVVGYADTDLLVKENPKDPQNRRISIILLQPKDAPPVAATLRKEVKASVQGERPAQHGTSDPAAEAAAREDTMKQSFQEKKEEMKKKKRDVMGLWD